MLKTDTSANSTDSFFQKFDINKKIEMFPKIYFFKIKNVQKFDINKKIEMFPQNHYFFKIKNVQKMLNYRDYILSNKKNKGIYRNFYCEKCFLRFRSESKKAKHFKTCNDNQTLIYPNEGAKLTFSNVTRTSKVPVLGFCDFESVLQRNSEREHCKLCNKDECQCNVAKTQNINTHRPIGYSILFVDSNNKVFYQEEYAGTDCVKHFFQSLKKYEIIVENQKKRFKKVTQIDATLKEWESYNNAKKCYICTKPFLTDNSFKYKKVVDHDHVSGKLLGAAHSLCNFKRQAPYHTTIFFHNAQG